MKGEKAYLLAFDVAAEIDLTHLPKIRGQQPVLYDLPHQHLAPRAGISQRPLAVTFDMPECGRPIQVHVHVYEVGVVSLIIREPLSNTTLSELVAAQLANPIPDEAMVRHATMLCQQVVREIAIALHRPVPLAEPEAYTVYVLTELDGTRDSATWLQTNRTVLAGLLTNTVPEQLAESQITEVLRQQQSFQKSDLVVVDWDAALVVALDGAFDDVLHVLELANLQLEEFRVMDQILDQQLDTAYALVEQRSGLRLRRTAAKLRELRALRVDLTKLADEVTHSTKFLGDWYLARVYQRAHERFHLDRWRASVEQRLAQLNELYSVVQAEISERRMLWLEIVVVVFFAIDLLTLIWAKK